MEAWSVHHLFQTATPVLGKPAADHLKAYAQRLLRANPTSRPAACVQLAASLLGNSWTATFVVALQVVKRHGIGPGSSSSTLAWPTNHFLSPLRTFVKIVSRFGMA